MITNRLNQSNIHTLKYVKLYSEQNRQYRDMSSKFIVPLLLRRHEHKYTKGVSALGVRFILVHGSNDLILQNTPFNLSSFFCI